MFMVTFVLDLSSKGNYNSTLFLISLDIFQLLEWYKLFEYLIQFNFSITN